MVSAIIHGLAKRHDENLSGAFEGNSKAIVIDRIVVSIGELLNEGNWTIEFIPAFEGD